MVLNYHTFLGLFFFSVLLFTQRALGQAVDKPIPSNQRIHGYKGIWFELNQKHPPYGDKYSGGLGTYTAKHIPLAIYSEQAGKTFFVYGGTSLPEETHLLCMIGYYDHKRRVVPEPTVVYDKMGVNDPHDNPSLLIDPEGYLWVFVSGRGNIRPGYKFRSSHPFTIDHFEQITKEEMTYPQPWYIYGMGMIHLFTKYTGIRELYFETSSDGIQWSDDVKLAGIIAPGDSLGGHYQVSNRYGNKISTFFNRHPEGHPDKRTDLYYLQTTDFGKTWTTVQGDTVKLPVTKVDHESIVTNYQMLNKNVYVKDLNFDPAGNPVCLYVTSRGHEPGPGNAPYEWRITKWNGKEWQTAVICTSDHNYDMGSLYIKKRKWKVIAPTIGLPKRYATGGEIVIRKSSDQGKTWKIDKQVTRNSQHNHAYIRRPVDARDPFYFLWADGDPHRLSKSFLYYGNSKGKYWQLPYETNSPFTRPVRAK